MPLAALTRELAEQIAREFPGLRRLNLSRNALQELEQLRLLADLEQLDLSRNQLRLLPADLGAWLPRLERLDLRGNAMYVRFELPFLVVTDRLNIHVRLQRVATGSGTMHQAAQFGCR